MAKKVVQKAKNPPSKSFRPKPMKEEGKNGNK